jgi:hypothetical protein
MASWTNDSQFAPQPARGLIRELRALISLWDQQRSRLETDLARKERGGVPLGELEICGIHGQVTALELCVDQLSNAVAAHLAGA